MKVTTKGQITIPLEIREKAGIMPGADVAVSFKNGIISIRKVANSNRGRELVRRMTGKGDVRMSTDEIMALTRGEH